MVIIYRYLSNQNSFFPYQNEVMKLHNFWVQIYILKIQILWFMPHSIQQSLRLFICFLVICKVVVFRISYFCSCIFFSSRDLVEYWAHQKKCVFQLTTGCVCINFFTIISVFKYCMIFQSYWQDIKYHLFENVDLRNTSYYK